jgi:hypothetical protein
MGEGDKVFLGKIVEALKAIEQGIREPLADRTITRTVLDDGLIISTIVTPDHGPETAVIDGSQTWIVERYPTADVARIGHARWVARLPALTAVDHLEYDGGTSSQQLQRPGRGEDAHLSRPLSRREL